MRSRPPARSGCRRGRRDSHRRPEIPRPAGHRHGTEFGQGRNAQRIPVDTVEGRWAAVVFWHSLEHLPDPGEVVRQAARLLRCSVPAELSSLPCRTPGVFRQERFGDRWLHLDLPRHLVHLSSESLQDGLRKSGFEILSTSSTRGGQIVIGWLDGLVSTMPGHLRTCYQALRGTPPIPFGSAPRCIDRHQHGSLPR